MHEHQSNGFHAGHLLLALMGGAIAGAGVAFLTAPASGSETRHRMRLMAHDTNLAVQRMPGAVRRASEAAREAFVGALEEFQEEFRGAEEEEATPSKRRGGQKAVTAKASKTRRG